MDNAVGAIVALTAEVWMLRERLGALEAELAARRVLPEGAVENHQDGPEQQQARAAELAALHPARACPSSPAIACRSPRSIPNVAEVPGARAALSPAPVGAAAPRPDAAAGCIRRYPG